MARNTKSASQQVTHLWTNNPIHTGWWYTYPSEKKMKVSWDDDIPN